MIRTGQVRTAERPANNSGEGKAGARVLLAIKANITCANIKIGTLACDSPYRGKAEPGELSLDQRWYHT